VTTEYYGPPEGAPNAEIEIGEGAAPPKREEPLQ
jgi:hypothetical protein